jgi:ATP-dependent Clp protease ATP-binding subunit ClpC
LSVDIPFSAETKRILMVTAEEADALLHQHIGPEHLLLGLLREEKSFAASILRKAGIGLTGVREQVAAQSRSISSDCRTDSGLDVLRINNDLFRAFVSSWPPSFVFSWQSLAEH